MFSETITLENVCCNFWQSFSWCFTVFSFQ